MIVNEISDERDLLEALVVDNPILEQLEDSLEHFNIFEALGAVNVELRHSDFLSFLFDPNQNHGLSDFFVKQFLQKSLSNANQIHLPFTTIDLDIWDLNNLIVYRERHNIDILMVDDLNKFVVIIENKVTTSEHGDQLNRYKKSAEQFFPKHRKLYLYLTPDGEDPSDEDYIAIDYKLISELIEKTTSAKESTLGPDVLTLMRHYHEMLRRHIVSDSDIVELCRKIYGKHKIALDLIYEHRPDQQAEIYDFLLGLIKRTPDLVLDHSTKSYIRFLPNEWKTSALKKGEKWTPSGYIILFEYTNSSDRLRLKLTIGPGQVQVRQKLLDMALNNDPPFHSPYKTLNQMYNNIYTHSVLSPDDYETNEIVDLIAKIEDQMDGFINHELPEFLKVMDAEEWIRTDQKSMKPP